MLDTDALVLDPEFHSPLLECCWAVILNARQMSNRIRRVLPCRNLPEQWTNLRLRNQDGTLPVSVYSFAFVRCKVRMNLRNEIRTSLTSNRSNSRLRGYVVGLVQEWNLITLLLGHRSVFECRTKFVDKLRTVHLALAKSCFLAYCVRKMLQDWIEWLETEFSVEWKVQINFILYNTTVLTE